jgi:histidine ammonia-lyase
MSSPVQIDGYSLTPQNLYALSFGKDTIELSEEAITRVNAGRDVVDQIVASGEIVYGINTGFGLFSNVSVTADKLGELQENLIRSHCAGVGNPLTMARTRMLLAVRINVLAKGHSGIRLSNVQKMIKAFNSSFLPVVPEKGTVGASGDLAPLSHLALGLMGEGKMWDPRTNEIGDAKTILADHNFEPITLGAKEGLALINGTQLIASLGAEAVERAANVAK